MKTISKPTPPAKCQCGWGLDVFGECSSCRVRKLAGLPDRAKCETCNNYKVGRCVNMGPNSVCNTWEAACAGKQQPQADGAVNSTWCYRCGEGTTPGLCRGSPRDRALLAA